MYAYLKGKLTESTVNHVVVETGGIGYKLLVPANLFAKLPQIGTEILLHLSFIVREQSHTLYGFFRPAERDLFEGLMGVTGVGPKLALSLIGHLSLEDLQQALFQSDLKVLSRVPGVGKKIAERLVVELRDKTSQLFPYDPGSLTCEVPSNVQSNKIRDAMNALLHLGYHQHTAQKALKTALSETSEELELAHLITHALKHV